SSIIQDDTINDKDKSLAEDEFHTSSIQILTSEKSTGSYPLIDKRLSSSTDESLQQKSISFILPNITENLYTILLESLQQMTDIEQISLQKNFQLNSEKQEIFHNLKNQFHKYKNDFNQIQKYEYFEIQPILRKRLELVIRTFDIDLQLIEQIFNGKTLTDLIPNKPSIIIKTSMQPIESQIYNDIISIRDNLSTIAINIKNCQII
ncbi:unnamed protein product, partial [Rotaria sordida]